MLADPRPEFTSNWRHVCLLTRFDAFLGGERLQIPICLVFLHPEDVQKLVEELEKGAARLSSSYMTWHT